MPQMEESVTQNIPKMVEQIGDAVLVSLAYKIYPMDKLNQFMDAIDDIMSNPANRKECENHLRSSGSNYVLFFLSNILYNLKQRGQLVLTDDVMKWLGRVWKKFLQRKKTYQELRPSIDEYRTKLRKYY